VKSLARFEEEFLSFMDSKHPEVGESIITEKKLTEDNEEALKKAIGEFKNRFEK